MRTLHHGLFATAALLAGFQAPAAEHPPGDQASLPEAIVQRRTYARAHPGESAIVLRTDFTNHQVTGACLYTVEGTVHRADPSADRVVPGLTPSDLDSLARVRRAVARLPAVHLAQDQPVPSAQSLADQLSAVGVAVSLRNHGPDEAILRFDWEDVRYAYTASSGCTVESASPTPASDLVDCVCFCADYRERHPNEKAILLAPPILAVGERIRCGAAFTDNGRLGLHLAARGSRLLVGHDASELTNPAQLYHVIARALPAATLGNVSNDGGDARLDLARVRSRLEQSGVTATLNDQVKGPRGQVDPSLARVVFEFDGRQFGYSPQAGSYFKGPAPNPVGTSFLDGVLFALAYRRDHPAERVIVIPHPPSDRTQPRKVVADTIFSAAGHLRVHSLLAGDFDLPELSTADLGRPDVLERALRPIYASRMKPGHRPGRSEAAGPLDSTAVAVRLLQFGQNAGLIPVRLRHEDGRIEAQSSQMVRFSWEGVDYLYRNNTCFTANRYSPDVL